MPKQLVLVKRAAHDRLLLAILTLVYIIIYSGILIVSHGRPYVLDNNESFSTLLHATNMYRFGLGPTAGLTDESNGPDAAQHPYVYTHQGNFPRFWALLLYVLGARSIETQIVITTFTVGAVGL